MDEITMDELIGRDAREAFPQHREWSEERIAEMEARWLREGRA